MARYLLKDIQSMMRGLQRVAQKGAEFQLTEISQRWASSSFRPLAHDALQAVASRNSQGMDLSGVPSRVGAVMQGVQEQLKITTGFAQRSRGFSTGFPQYSERIDKRSSKAAPTVTQEVFGRNDSKPDDHSEASEAAKRAEKFMNPPIAPMDPEDKNGVLPDRMGATDKGAKAAQRLGKFMNEEVAAKTDKFQKDSSNTQKLSFDDGENSVRVGEFSKKTDSSAADAVAGSSSLEDKPDHQPPKAIAKQTLGNKSRERKVPASRAARLATFGGLAAGLGIGALAEVTRRTFGMNQKEIGPSYEKSAFLTDANAERIVDTLCRVRGAALKLGQMISIQDTTLINPQVKQIFERVRQGADFMPKNQMEKIMEKEFGMDWRSRLLEFDDKPFAAASIGQVHLGKLKDGREVAVKVQYPGVAEGIDSDIKNLMGILTMWNIFPKGMYMDNLMKVARVELAWECDYVREAQYMKQFRELLKNDPVFVVPDVIDELSSKRVLTTEYIYGEPLDRAVSYDQESRNEIAKNFLRLCFEELFIYRLMQTDPNWANFFYNYSNKKIYLLDFGASRTFDKKFTDSYIEIIKGAATGKRDLVLKNSIKLGFLTGFETKLLETSHVDAAMILGEPFKTDEPYDFGSQDITKRIHSIIPVMAEHRLTPPPEESYSLHRKIAGAFLLCTNLKAKMRCKEVFDSIYARHQMTK